MLDAKAYTGLIGLKSIIAVFARHAVFVRPRVVCLFDRFPPFEIRPGSLQTIIRMAQLRVWIVWLVIYATSAETDPLDGFARAMAVGKNEGENKNREEAEPCLSTFSGSQHDERGSDQAKTFSLFDLKSQFGSSVLIRREVMRNTIITELF